MVAKDRVLHGVSVACVTPMNHAGSRIEYDAIGPYVDFLCQRGVQGLFVLGTTGEGYLLSMEERRRSTEAFIRASKGRALVVPQCGAMVFEDTRELIQHAGSCGADGAAVVTPFYFSYSQNSLYDYYTSILESERNLPIYAYNIPFMTNNSIETETLIRLAERYPNFCGVKDSSGNAVKILECVNEVPETFAVIVGSDQLFLPLLFSGVKGCVSGPGAVIPEPFVKVYTEFKENRLQQARETQWELTVLSGALDGGGNLDLLKKALGWRGLAVGSVRPPLEKETREAEEFKRARFEALWEKAGFTL